MPQQIDHHLIKITKFYFFSFVALMAITSFLDPLAYAFGNMMIGRGRFADFYDIVVVAKNYPNIGSYCVTPWHYSFYQIFDQFKINANSLFIGYNFIIIMLAGMVVAELKKIFQINTNSIYLLIFSYPVLFGLWRGNTEVLSFLLFFLATIYLYQQDATKSFKWYLLSVFTKPNYLINGVIYLSAINKKILLQGILFVAICFLLIYSFDNPKHAVDVSSACLAKYIEAYISGDGGTLFNNSLYGLVKSTLYSLYNYHDANIISNTIYSHFTKYWWLIFGGISFYAVRKYSYEETLFIVLASFIFLYPVSADYRLASLCIPVLFMTAINYEKWKFVIYTTLVIMLPKHFIWFRLTELDVNVTLNSFANPILLLIAITTVFVKGNNGSSARVS